MPLAAPLIGAAVGIGGSLLTSSATKKAGNAAAQAQQYAADQAIAEQRRQFDTAQQNFAPFLNAGTSALDQQRILLGLGSYAPMANADGSTQSDPDFQQMSAIQQLQQSPLYQSLFRNGQETILQNGSATGGLRGGNIQRSLANFGSDTLAQVIQNQLANLGGLSGQGAGAAGALGNLGANAANQIGGAFGDAGAAQAGAYLNAGRANAGAISSISGALGGLAGNSSIQTAFGKLF